MHFTTSYKFHSRHITKKFILFKSMTLIFLNIILQLSQKYNRQIHTSSVMILLDGAVIIYKHSKPPG